MKTILFGATGMVGSGALLACLGDPRVESVLIVGRRSCGVAHAKVEEVVLPDLFDLSTIAPRFADRDACFFCLGVSSVGMSEPDYHRMTFDLTVAAAKAMEAAKPGLTFCYVSGAGTDSTEQGRTMWARVKGKTENALLHGGFKAAFMFRPAYIQPLDGIRSKTRLYQAAYSTIGAFYPVLRRLFPRYVTTTRDLGRAMIEVSAKGYAKTILDSDDINRLGSGATGVLP